MTEALRPARPVPPGRILKQELEARGWSQKDLAAILGRPEQMVSEIVNGTKQITPETSLELAQAFGNSPELWLNLETNYRLEIARRGENDDAIARRSQLYDALPLREMARRGWLCLHESADALEHEVRDLLGQAVTAAPVQVARLRASTTREPLTYAQLAWLRRAEALAQEQATSDWAPEHLEPLVVELLALARRIEDVALVPSLLARWGVGCVFLRHLPKTYLDGAAFWSNGRPTVALTLRHDRVDAFWFTLMHELAHVAAGGQVCHLDRLEDGGEESGIAIEQPDHDEETADRLAANWLVSPVAFQRFVAATQPYFSRPSIESFAADQGRHPGIILGRLQREHLVPWQNLRPLLAKITPYLKEHIRG